jgi:type IV pilus assembly protein PilB
VEFLIEGARQVKLNPKLDFEGALRAILRHDPDIVMVGEIRDKITADLAIKLANTGHLTLSTLHTNDAASAVSRLFKMGIEPFLIAYSINIILAQRLVRKLCDRCKVPMEQPEVEAMIKLGMKEEELSDAKLYRPVGCISCIKGFKGRAAIYEALPFTKSIRTHILK